MTKYELYSNQAVNKASNIIKDNIIKLLSNNNHHFVISYNDLYFLKSGKTVRRLKGWFKQEINISTLMDLKELIKSCSTDEFECDINMKKYLKDKYRDGILTDYIIKIINK